MHKHNFVNFLYCVAAAYTVSFNQSMIDVNENSGKVTVTLILSYPPLNEVTVAVFATFGSAIGKNKATV